MKLLYCIPQLYNAGGMERVLTEKVNYLASQYAYQIRIVTTEIVPKGKPISYFPLHPSVEVIRLNIDFDRDFHAPLWRKYIAHIAKQHRYRRQLKQLVLHWQPDWVISLCGKEIEFLGKMSLPCHTLGEMHFAFDQRQRLLSMFHPGKIWAWLGTIRVRQLIHSAKRLHRFIVLTHADRMVLEESGCHNVSCIVNPSSVSPDSLGEHDQKQVLAVGRLHPQKGFDLLLQAWNLIVPKHPDWVLRIVGEGDERPHLEQLISQLNLNDHVRMDGLSDKVEDAYRHSPIFVLSSRYEGLPLALMEAMSCGCCAISYDCPNGPKELIRQGETGILISPEDINALASAIDTMINQPVERQHIGEAAYQYAQSHFALPPIMEQWKNIFESCK